MFGEEEVHLNCPYCGAPISLLLEAMYTNQEYIEDCEVCCRPLLIKYTARDGKIENLSVERAQD